MKLIIKRDQKAQTGVFGGHKGMTFLLTCHIELTPEEQALVAKYKANMHPLTFTERDGVKIPKDTVSSLMGGVTEELKDITILLNNEEVIKEACKGFKTLRKLSTIVRHRLVAFTVAPRRSSAPGWAG